MEFLKQTNAVHCAKSNDIGLLNALRMILVGLLIPTTLTGTLSLGAKIVR